MCRHNIIKNKFVSLVRAERYFLAFLIKEWLGFIIFIAASVSFFIYAIDPIFENNNYYIAVFEVTCAIIGIATYLIVLHYKHKTFTLKCKIIRYNKALKQTV